MKHTRLVLTGLILVAGILVAACSGTATPPAATSAPAQPAAAAPTTAQSAPAAPAAPAAPTSAPAAATTATYNLKFTDHEPPGSPFNAVIQKWADEINQKTGGKVKITIYPAETLAKGTDAVPAVKNGIADMGWAIVAFFPGQFPMTEVFTLPVLGIPSSKVGADALWDVYSENKQMQNEWSSVHLVGFTVSGSQFIATSKKPVHTMADVKGLKLRVAGFGGTELFKDIGASPVNIAPPDMYDAINKGVLDGCVFDWMGIQSNKLNEVLNYASVMPIVYQPQAVIMNKDKWNSLPPDIQKVFNEVGGKYLGEMAATGAFDMADKEGVANFKKQNKEVITFSPDEVQKWTDAAKPVWAKWVESAKAKGDSQAALDQLMAAIAKNK